MKIKMLTSMAGANMLNVGDVVDMPAAAAKRLIKRGFAEKANNQSKNNLFAAVFGGGKETGEDMAAVKRERATK